MPIATRFISRIITIVVLLALFLLFIPSFYRQNNQLDFLLEKASEYSNFIRNDLQQLQFQMTEEAQKKMEKAERKRKKESGGGKSGSSGKKKRMNNGASEHLKSAQDKDAVYRAGSRPIFIQPPNLSTDCTLKDYQLEGVRWLVSLYENGVSGILADEVCVIFAMPMIAFRRDAHQRFE